MSIIVVKQLLGELPSGCLTGISGARSGPEHVSAIKQKPECESNRVASEHSLASQLLGVFPSD